METSIIIILYVAVYLLLLVIYKIHSKNLDVNATSFFLIFYAFSGICSYIFYMASNGVNRAYYNISVIPFVYLISCILLSFLPVYKFDTYSPHIIVSRKQYKIIDNLSLFLSLCCVLPILETIIHLPSALSSETGLGEMYDKRLMGIATQDYLSWLSRKLYYCIMLCSLLLPICLFAQLAKKNVNKGLIIGLSGCIILDALHNMINGGRSSFMQNLLYLIIVYFLFKNQLSKKKLKYIRLGGLAVVGISIAAMLAVTISRFINDNSGVFDNPFIWMTLYAGEGTLNFNNDLWYVNQTIGGYKTIGLPMGLLSGHFVSVKEVWELGDKLGVAGNIFYTWIGTLCMDWGKTATLIVVVIMTLVVYCLVVRKKKLMRLTSFIFLCLWARILIMGPIFYTYSTIESQYCLLVCFLFCIILNAKHVKI